MTGEKFDRFKDMNILGMGLLLNEMKEEPDLERIFFSHRSILWDSFLLVISCAKPRIDYNQNPGTVKRNEIVPCLREPWRTRPACLTLRKVHCERTQERPRAGCFTASPRQTLVQFSSSDNSRKPEEDPISGMASARWCSVCSGEVPQAVRGKKVRLFWVFFLFQPPLIGVEPVDEFATNLIEE